jgi:hypothetical protein
MFTISEFKKLLMLENVISLSKRDKLIDLDFENVSIGSTPILQLDLSWSGNATDILRCLANRECSVDEDYIYGSLGLFPLEIRKKINVEYKIGLQKAQNKLFDACIGYNDYTLLYTKTEKNNCSWYSNSQKQIGRFCFPGLVSTKISKIKIKNNTLIINNYLYTKVNLICPIIDPNIDDISMLDQILKVIDDGYIKGEHITSALMGLPVIGPVKEIGYLFEYTLKMRKYGNAPLNMFYVPQEYTGQASLLSSMITQLLQGYTNGTIWIAKDIINDNYYFIWLFLYLGRQIILLNTNVNYKDINATPCIAIVNKKQVGISPSVRKECLKNIGDNIEIK